MFHASRVMILRRSRKVPVVGALVLALLLAIGPLSQSVAQEATPAPADNVYVDPDGRFSIPVPTNWTVDVEDGLVVLTDPEGDFTTTVAVVEADDARTGAEEAWALVDPEFDTTPPPGSDMDVPSQPGVDETVVITYDPGIATGQVVQALVQRIENQAYVLVFQGSLDAAIRRDAQIQVIASGFTFGDLDVADLSGVAPGSFSGDLVTEFEAYAEELLERLEVPGASVVVVQDNEIVYTGAFGVKELGGDDPITADSLMMIGSTTKSFTTLMMATEVDDGLMDWDTRVVEILPEFEVADPEITEALTVRNLVCACTGVPRQDFQLIFEGESLDPERVIESLATFEFYTDLGEAFQYSNQMVAAGGFVAAAADGGEFGNLGEAYAESLQARVLDPLGMNRTTLSVDEAVADPDHAMPHGAGLDLEYHLIPVDLERFVEPVAPAGALWSSANEMGSYLLLQLGDGTMPDGQEIVSAMNLNVTREPQIEVSAESSYGLGWFIDRYKGLELIHHGGATLGYGSDFAFVPEANLGIAVLINAQGAGLYGEALRYRLLELLYGQPAEYDEQIEFLLDLIEEELTADVDEADRYPDPADVAPYLGRYVNEMLGEVTLQLDGDRFVIDAGEFASELWLADDPELGLTGYVMSDPSLAGLPIEVREIDGAPALVIREGIDERVFVQIESFAPEATPPAATPAPAAVATPEAA
jgi:CubicO group peptidase (beta-lactamase class C family)